MQTSLQLSGSQSPTSLRHSIQKSPVMISTPQFRTQVHTRMSVFLPTNIIKMAILARVLLRKRLLSEGYLWCFNVLIILCFTLKLLPMSLVRFPDGILLRGLQPRKAFIASTTLDGACNSPQRNSWRTTPHFRISVWSFIRIVWLTGVSLSWFSTKVTA